jgi:methionyl-tRNA formyltransferase
MKIAFLGTPEISAYVLQELYNKKFDIKWVATQPDRQSGRGRKFTPSPVKEKAVSLGIDVLQSDKFDKPFFEKIKTYGDLDLAIVIAYGLYLPTFFLSYPKYSCLNIHFSLLPKYRGAAPVARAIMGGESETGITIMKPCKEMDAGDIIAQEKIAIDIEDTTESLTWTLVKKGTELLTAVIPEYIENKVKPIEQSSTGIEATYAKKILADERFINWDRDTVTIHDQTRALYPWPIAETKINGISLKLIQTRPGASVMVDQDSSVSGTILSVDKKTGFLVVKTNDGVLLVEKVQPSGKREMSVAEFINGHEIKKGMRFE